MAVFDQPQRQRPEVCQFFNKSKGAPGPVGQPNWTQANNSSVQQTRFATEYGSIVAVTVPIPALGT